MRIVEEDTNLYIQVNEKIHQGHIGIGEKVQEASLDSGIQNIVCVCAITVLHERWMQDTPTSHCVTW